ncbi:FRAS1-related extracellular matrix protein 1b isoform X1 [Nelusetta ayraudi]|uniref:FRAS1-related extracellular matrix protein 1b isoform X1 n=1 Tax=Nelusetta ayraudi TaxID=303726 RepID=UPI003F71847A
MAAVQLLLLLLAAVAAQRPSTVTSDLRVTRGGESYLTEAELKVEVVGGAQCKVEVVLNEPVTQRVGRLTPQVFDCPLMEQQQQVKYVHNGSPLLEEDAVMLRVYRLSATETQVETVVLQVKVLAPPPGAVQLTGRPLLVPHFYGLSNPIDRSVLHLQPPPHLLCTVRLVTSDLVVPALGRLVREVEEGVEANTTAATHRKGREVEEAEEVQEVELCPGNAPCPHRTTPVRFLKTSCHHFLTSDLKYQHLRPPSPEVDYVPIRVELREKESRALLEARSVWLPVEIGGAVPNTRPRASFSASLLLEVDQFILTPLSTASLDALDHETPQEQLVFNVTAPPAAGYITHLDDPTRPSTSFTWADLHHLRMAYQPPAHGQSQRTNYQVEFQVIDAHFLRSPPLLLHISIRSAETNAPRVSWNTGLDLLEGQSRPISWQQLQVVDRDNPQDVVLVAVDGPLHGRLTVRGGAAFMFRLVDLQEGVVVYHHSGSDTTRDHVVFRVSDGGSGGRRGGSGGRHRFPIRILPLDDSPPFLLAQRPLQVREGGAVRLGAESLLAADLDSSDDLITYRLEALPTAGQLVRRSSAHDPGSPVSSGFQQQELLQGRIFYVHWGEELFHDSFQVSLADCQQPPNLSETFVLEVQVFPVEDQVPVEVEGSRRWLTLRETEVLQVTQQHLHFRDGEQPGAELTYTITTPCWSPEHPGLMDAGRLFLRDGAGSMKRDPTVAVLKTFTQEAINHLKVAFMPPVEDIGPDPLQLHFIFSVSDQQGGAVSGLFFNITVLPVDDQAPEVFTNLLRVEEGGAALLTEQHLLVRDRDTRGEGLKAALQATPLHGHLELQGRALRRGEGFSLQDLKELRVRYVHDDSETSEDQVELLVSDGVNTAEASLSIQVLPVNDQPPQLGGALWAGLSCPEGGRVQVTQDFLWASDGDSEEELLLFLLARSPSRGQLQRGGQPTDRFSQHDLLQGLVYYVHTGGEIGPEPVLDVLTLIISDGEAGGGAGAQAPPPPVPLHGTLPVYDLNVTLLPVNNQVPVVTLGPSLLVVDEGSRACLCGGLLGASDLDSPPDLLTFHLEAPPLHGFLENTLPTPGSEKSNAGVAVESFTLAHLTSGFINYVQSESRGVEPTADQLSVSVSDGLHRSGPAPFYIIIQPTNDEEPSLHFTNFTVEEGGASQLTSSVLSAADLDAPADLLTFTVVTPPTHGRLFRVGQGGQGAELLLRRPRPLPLSPAVTSFSLQELQHGVLIWYLHDDSETLTDAVALQLTDGHHSVQRSAKVTVLPVNDQEPRLLRNVGVAVVPGERRLISSVALDSQDLDSPPQHLFYFLQAGPRLGSLQLKTAEGWAPPLAPGLNFTQEDVDQNRVWYQHRETAEVKGHDSFRFTLSDLEHQTPAHTFFITIHTPHRGELQLTTSGDAVVLAGQRLVLSTDLLLARDQSGRPERLRYRLTAAPQHGLLHSAGRPGVPLSTWSQLDLAAQRLCYTHDNSRHTHTDSFSFVVTNGESSRSGVLHLTIRHADRVPPTLLRNTGLRLQGSASEPVTSQHLQLSDPDTAAANLTFRLTVAPRHGELLLLGGAPLAPPLSFTQDHLDQQDLVYQHHPGSLETFDSFSFLPSDGTNAGYLQFGQLREEPQVFSIQVELADSAPPSLTTRQSPSTVVSLGGGRHAVFITSAHLAASDRDSPAERLQFSVTAEPRFGHLENHLTGAYIQSRFTQKDLRQRAVLYVIPPDQEVTSDSFQFRLSDPAGNSAAPETLEVSWSRIQFSASCYRTCETSGTLELHITRSGRSADPAYVTVQVEEGGSARPGRDFTHSSSGLVQFDPGVNMKSWKVQLVDDGLEENHETFTVTLRTPHNAVLGQQSSASVEILDPRGGRCSHQDLQPGGAGRKAPPPPTQGAEPVAEIEAELLWEVPSPHPPRGDVPDHRPLPQDHQTGVTGVTGSGLVKGGVSAEGTADRVWTFHSLTPLRLEKVQPGDLWSSSAHSRPLQEPSVSDAPQMDHPEAAQQRKVGRWQNSWCAEGWTLYRGRCYLLDSSLASWGSARRSCSLRSNSSLVTVASRREVSWLWKFSSRKPFWIAGLSGDPWSWAEGGRSSSRLQGAPEGSCLLVEGPRRWRSTPCSPHTQHAFICSSPTVPH